MTNLMDQTYDVDEVIAKIVEKYGLKPSALIMILQDVQKHYNYLPKSAMIEVGKKMNLPVAQIFGVATFYKSFSLEPKGRNHVCVCTGTACHVRQANVILEKVERELGIKAGETTKDKEYSLERVNCLGACALGPLVTMNEHYYGNMTVTKVDKMLAEVKTEGQSPKVEKEVAA